MTREPWKSPDWLEPDWTDRQLEVLRLIARGRTNPEISEDLGVSFAGAKWHVSEVLSKLGVLSREDAAAYWRWHTSRRVRVKLWMRSVAAVGIAKAAVGGAVLVVAGSALVGVVVWSFDGDGDSVPAGAEETAAPLPTLVAEAETASIELNVTQQVDRPSLFGDDGPPIVMTSDGATITLQRVLETGGDTIVCVEFGGVFVARKRLTLELGNPSLVSADGATSPTSATGRTDKCPNNSYVFEDVTGTVTDGGWLVFPYSAEAESGSVLIAPVGPDEEIKTLPVPRFMPEAVKFEWLDPAIDVDLAARANTLLPGSWGADSPYYGTDNRAELGSFESWDGDWSVSVFRYAGEVCLLLHNPQRGYQLGCAPNGTGITIGSRGTGSISFGVGAIRVTSAWAMGDEAAPRGAIPEGARIWVDETFRVPDDFGADLAFAVRYYEYDIEAD